MLHCHVTLPAVTVSGSVSVARTVSPNCGLEGDRLTLPSLSSISIVTARIVLAPFWSAAFTVTLYVLSSSVTPAFVRIWPVEPLMSKDAASVPSRLYVTVSPVSASVALKGWPMFVPARALMTTLREVLVPSANTGAWLGGAAVASIETVMRVVSVPSSAATITVYVTPAISVTPDFVRSWPLAVSMSKFAASRPSRL